MALKLEIRTLHGKPYNRCGFTFTPDGGVVDLPEDKLDNLLKAARRGQVRGIKGRDGVLGGVLMVHRVDDETAGLLNPATEMHTEFDKAESKGVDLRTKQEGDEPLPVPSSSAKSSEPSTEPTRTEVEIGSDDETPPPARRRRRNKDE